jgi:hypothetical protein
MPSPARLCAYGLGFAAAELAGGIALAAAVGMQRVSLVLAVSAVLTAGAAIALRRLLRPGGGGGEGEGTDPPGGGEPPWWPDFERDLRDYMGDRERTPAP